MQFGKYIYFRILMYRYIKKFNAEIIKNICKYTYLAAAKRENY